MATNIQAVTPIVISLYQVHNTGRSLLLYFYVFFGGLRQEDSPQPGADTLVMQPGVNQIVPVAIQHLTLPHSVKYNYLVEFCKDCKFSHCLHIQDGTEYDTALSVMGVECNSTGGR